MSELLSPPRFQFCGVVEGFYGVLWTFEQRKEMVNFMSSNRMNHYLYAPKEDPYHRMRWRENYPAKTLQQFEGFIKHCTAQKVTFNFGISPGVDFNYSNEGDLLTLIQKITALANLGCTHFTLLMDDIPAKMEQDSSKPTANTIEDAQTNLANQILKKLEAQLGPLTNFQFFFYPTFNWGNLVGDHKHSSSRAKYWKTIADIDSRYIFLWTGMAVVSHDVSKALFKKLSQMFGKTRKFILWDNYPSGAPNSTRMNLGPYCGREADLDSVIKGILVNPMAAMGASKIPLQTCFDFIRNPHEYDMLKSFQSSLKKVFGDDQVASAMFELIRNAPATELHKDNPFFSAPHMSANLDFFVDLKTKCRFVRERCSVINKSLHEDLLPFLDTAETFFYMNELAISLEEALTGPKALKEQRMETIRVELTNTTRKLESLMHPTRSAKQLALVQEDLNRCFLGI